MSRRPLSGQEQQVGRRNVNLQERFNQLEEREQKLLKIMGGIFLTMVVLLLPTYVAMSVGERRAENERILEIIREIKDERVTLSRRQAEAARVDRRYARQAPALAGFLAKTADEVGVDIPETQDRSTVPVGKSFKERSTKIRLRDVGLLKLSNFMEKVESSGYPLSISRLTIRRRGTKPDQYDVEMDVSAFDQDEPKKPKKDEDEE